MSRCGEWMLYSTSLFAHSGFGTRCSILWAIWAGKVCISFEANVPLRKSELERKIPTKPLFWRSKLHLSFSRKSRAISRIAFFVRTHCSPPGVPLFKCRRVLCFPSYVPDSPLGQVTTFKTAKSNPLPGADSGCLRELLAISLHRTIPSAC